MRYLLAASLVAFAFVAGNTRAGGWGAAAAVGQIEAGRQAYELREQQLYLPRTPVRVQDPLWAPPPGTVTPIPSAAPACHMEQLEFQGRILNCQVCSTGMQCF